MPSATISAEGRSATRIATFRSWSSSSCGSSARAASATDSNSSAGMSGCGDRAGMTDEWGLVLRLDAAAASPQPLMPADELESVAAPALAELPQELLDQLRNVAILVADRPSAEMVADGLDPRVLGLYH